MKFKREHNIALEDAIESVRDTWGFKISFEIAASLVSDFLENLDSEDRDFSDEMIEARKTFAKLTDEQPGECPSKLWEDALASVGKT